MPAIPPAFAVIKPAGRPLFSRRLRRLAGLLLGLCGELATGPTALAQGRPAAGLGARPVYPNPARRPLILQANALPSRRVTTKADGLPLREVSGQPGTQVRLTAVAPLLITKPITILAGFNFMREQGSYAHETPGPNPTPTVEKYTRRDISLSITVVRRDSLFHRPVLYQASVTGTSRSFGKVERFTGGLTGLLTLRNTPGTRLAVGLTVQANPTVSLPVVPVVAYWHRLGRSPWELDVVLPQQAYLRRPVLAQKCWVSVGTELMSSHSFGSGTVPGFSDTSEANTVSLQSGLLFEYCASRYLLLGLRGGLDSPLTQWVSEKNSSDRLVMGEANAAGFVGVVLSVTVPSKNR